MGTRTNGRPANRLNAWRSSLALLALAAASLGVAQGKRISVTGPEEVAQGESVPFFVSLSPPPAEAEGVDLQWEALSGDGSRQHGRQRLQVGPAGFAEASVPGNFFAGAVQDGQVLAWALPGYGQSVADGANEATVAVPAPGPVPVDLPRVGVTAPPEAVLGQAVPVLVSARDPVLGELSVVLRVRVLGGGLGDAALTYDAALGRSGFHLTSVPLPSGAGAGVWVAVEVLPAPDRSYRVDSGSGTARVAALAPGFRGSRVALSGPVAAAPGAVTAVLLTAVPPPEPGESLAVGLRLRHEGLSVPHPETLPNEVDEPSAPSEPVPPEAPDVVDAPDPLGEEPSAEEVAAHEEALAAREAYLEAKSEYDAEKAGYDGKVRPEFVRALADHVVGGLLASAVLAERERIIGEWLRIETWPQGVDGVSVGTMGLDGGALLVDDRGAAALVFRPHLRRRSPDASPVVGVEGISQAGIRRDADAAFGSWPLDHRAASDEGQFEAAFPAIWEAALNDSGFRDASSERVREGRLSVDVVPDGGYQVAPDAAGVEVRLDLAPREVSARLDFAQGDVLEGGTEGRHEAGQWARLIGRVNSGAVGGDAPMVDELKISVSTTEDPLGKRRELDFRGETACERVPDDPDTEDVGAGRDCSALPGGEVEPGAYCCALGLRGGVGLLDVKVRGDLVDQPESTHLTASVLLAGGLPLRGERRTVRVEVKDGDSPAEQLPLVRMLGPDGIPHGGTARFLVQSLPARDLDDIRVLNSGDGSRVADGFDGLFGGDSENGPGPNVEGGHAVWDVEASVGEDAPKGAGFVRATPLAEPAEPRYRVASGGGPRVRVNAPGTAFPMVDVKAFDVVDEKAGGTSFLVSKRSNLDASVVVNVRLTETGACRADVAWDGPALADDGDCSSSTREKRTEITDIQGGSVVSAVYPVSWLDDDAVDANSELRLDVLAGEGYRVGGTPARVRIIEDDRDESPVELPAPRFSLRALDGGWPAQGGAHFMLVSDRELDAGESHDVRLIVEGVLLDGSTVRRDLRGPGGVCGVDGVADGEYGHEAARDQGVDVVSRHTPLCVAFGDEDVAVRVALDSETLLDRDYAVGSAREVEARPLREQPGGDLPNVAAYGPSEVWAGAVAPFVVASDRALTDGVALDVTGPVVGALAERFAVVDFQDESERWRNRRIGNWNGFWAPAAAVPVSPDGQGGEVVARIGPVGTVPRTFDLVPGRSEVRVDVLDEIDRGVTVRLLGPPSGVRGGEVGLVVVATPPPEAGGALMATLRAPDGTRVPVAVGPQGWHSHPVALGGGDPFDGGDQVRACLVDDPEEAYRIAGDKCVTVPLGPARAGAEPSVVALTAPAAAGAGAWVPVLVSVVPPSARPVSETLATLAFSGNLADGDDDLRSVDLGVSGAHVERVRVASASGTLTAELQEVGAGLSVHGTRGRVHVDIAPPAPALFLSIDPKSVVEGETATVRLRTLPALAGGAVNWTVTGDVGRLAAPASGTVALGASGTAEIALQTVRGPGWAEDGQVRLAVGESDDYVIAGRGAVALSIVDADAPQGSAVASVSGPSAVMAGAPIPFMVSVSPAGGSGGIGLQLSGDLASPGECSSGCRVGLGGDGAGVRIVRSGSRRWAGWTGKVSARLAQPADYHLHPTASEVSVRVVGRDDRRSPTVSLVAPRTARAGGRFDVWLVSDGLAALDRDGRRPVLRSSVSLVRGAASFSPDRVETRRTVRLDWQTAQAPVAVWVAEAARGAVSVALEAREGQNVDAANGRVEVGVE